MTPEEEQELVDRLVALEERMLIFEKGLEKLVEGMERVAASQKDYIDQKLAPPSSSTPVRDFKDPFAPKFLP